MTRTEQSVEGLPMPEDATIAELLALRKEFLRFLSARVAGAGEAEDILQAAYMRALAKGAEIKNTESVVSWFYRVLRNSVIDHYRRNGARDRAHEQFGAQAPASYETEFQANLCTCVGSVVQGLKPEYRSVLERIDLGNESVAEFARTEGTTQNNASVRLHRARRAAASKLTKVCGACAEHKCLDCTCKRGV